jgi:dienelactone hydrolase
MAELLIFHHAQGLTPGVRAFGGRMAAAGHTVHVPDLYDGRTFDTLDEGIAHAGEIGFDTVRARGAAAAERLPDELVYVGFSLGVMAAQTLAQTRPGTRAAVLFHSCVDPAAFGAPWPAGAPLQIHIMDRDPLASPPEVDIETARRLDAELAEAELFLYPGDRHLFADESLGGYDAAAAQAAEARVLALLERLP